MKGLLFTYLLTYGGAVVALINPFVGVLIYIAFAILMPEELWPWSVPHDGNYSRTVAIALLVGWALKGFGSWQFGRGRAVITLLIGFWIWSAICATRAPNQAVAWGFVEHLAKIVLPILVGITSIDSVRKLKQLIWVIFLCEGYLALEFNLSYFGGYNRLRLEGFGPMDNNCNAIALVTCLGLSLNVGLLEEIWWRKALTLGASALMAHAILFSFSRGGMLAVGLTGLVTFVLMPKQPKHYVMMLVAILLVVRLAGPEVVARLSQTLPDQQGRLDESAESRLGLWADCWDVMKKKPIFGAGPDHWPLIASSYGWREGKEAHSLWMQMGADLGIPGVALLALYYLVCMTRLLALTNDGRPVSDPWLHEAARMVVASLIGFAISAQFVSLRFLEQPYYIALVGAGVLKLSSLQVTTAPPDSRDPTAITTMECPWPPRELMIFDGEDHERSI